ncbi:hypothetical protein QFW80_00040 [Luteimonas sp. M1R5S18]|uniref:Site-specific DNA-methyltransferase (adenine-specific) n=1 Tax=Luteimonas rhizosphaericola TaxID=3042024 RepID=A0ABT6JES3_9GAMM|nr:hypothetical protein [Luteimonas rhizosphaericola]MDH5828913.1 hypothetical protein [Luteimonas rhizosphaericola]
MTESEALFLRTLEDIERRLGQTDPYEILFIAALIRKLFLDDFPLVDQVNRNHKIKLTFETTLPIELPKDFPAPSFWTVQDGLDPDTAIPGKRRYTTSRDQFFQTVVTIVNDHQYSVREVVLFEANVMGAVHAGSPKTDKEHALKQVDSTIAVGGYASSLRQLQAIARVVLKTLSPLRAAASAA